MAPGSSDTSNEDLISELQDYNIINSELVAEVMTATDRKFYCPNNPYVHRPQVIDDDVTISSPQIHAFALESLRNHLKPGAHVLDVGSGSGYLTACFFRLMNAKGEHPDTKVVGIEHKPQLVSLGMNNIQADDPSMLDSGKLVFVHGDGHKGHSTFAPYDVIYVGAAISTEPTALLEQLKNGGRLIVPVEPESGTQYIEQYDKDANGNIQKTKLMGITYLPVTDFIE